VNVGNLLISLGIQTDRRSFRAAEGAIGSMRRSMIGFAAYFGAKAMGKALLGFNANIEDSKNSIAGMLALAKKSSFSGELQTASDLYDGLRKKAATLPGTTKDYVNTLSMLVEPMARAGLSTEQMLDMTTNTAVAARGMQEGWQKASRDISEFINFGKMNKVDTFLRRLFPEFDNDEGHKKLKAMTNEARAMMALTKLKQPALIDLGKAQSESFSGRIDKLKDRAQMLMAKVGEGLFKALKPAMDRLDEWMGENDAEIQATAEAISDGLVSIFEAGQSLVEWISEHGDVVKSFLRAIAGLFLLLTMRAVLAWLAIAWPFIAAAVAIAGLIEIFYKLKGVFGETAAIFATLFLVGGILKFTGLIGKLTQAMWGLKTASTAAAGAAGFGGGGGGSGAAGGFGGGALNKQMLLQGGLAAGQRAGGRQIFDSGWGTGGYDFAADRARSRIPTGPQAAGRQMFEGGWGEGGYNFAADKRRSIIPKVSAGMVADAVPTALLAISAREFIKAYIDKNIDPDSTLGKVVDFITDGGMMGYMAKKLWDAKDVIIGSVLGESDFLANQWGMGLSNKTWVDKAGGMRAGDTTININTPTTNNFAGMVSADDFAARMVATGKAIQDANLAKAQQALAGNKKKGKRR
jgi:hypothetical protein